MAHPVLALGAAALTAAGSAWYLPALTDLRAGDDRPRSTRLAATACLTWWLTAAATCALLLTPLPRQTAGAVATAGAAGALLLRLAAGTVRRAEQREAARRWAELPTEPAPSARPPGRGPTAPARLAAGLAVVVAAVFASGVLLTLHAPATGRVFGAAACAAVGVPLLALRSAARRGVSAGGGR